MTFLALPKSVTKANSKTKTTSKSTSKNVGKKDTKEQTGKKPKSPLPKQQQKRPGIGAKMKPQPQYLAPDYRGAEKLKGKAALITGGDSGIGRAVAVLYAREGADVAIIYLKTEQKDAEETARQIENEGGKSLLSAGDVTDL